jgi:hypothetical protein
MLEGTSVWPEDVNGYFAVMGVTAAYYLLVTSSSSHTSHSTFSCTYDHERMEFAEDRRRDAKPGEDHQRRHPRAAAPPTHLSWEHPQGGPTHTCRMLCSMRLRPVPMDASVSLISTSSES